MKKRVKLLPLLAVAAPAFSAVGAEASGPNVILIMSDDHGYGDVEHTGNPYINTPNLNKLQAESIVFDNFHTATTSSPTRSQLMTGRSCNAVGVWHTVQGRSILRPEDYTLANAFKDSGYATAMYGKWHLGDNYPARPFDKGFDDVLWHKGGGVGQAPDYWGNTYDNDFYFRGETPEKQEGYCTDVWFSEAKRFITESNESGKPFFCYLALNAAHAPFNVDEKYAAPYKGNPQIQSSNFYGMITNIDDNIGELVAHLEQLGIDDNTVIIFFGDNGSSGGLSQDADGNLLKGYDAGFRGKKGSNYEGGHRQSMVMHIPNRGGQKVEALTSCVDMMPTLISLCGLTPSVEISTEGFDFLAEDYTGIDRVYVIDTQRSEHLIKYKQSCVAKNDWRLINGDKLYHLKVDRRQQHNLAADYPEVVADLKQEYEKWWELASARADIYSCIPLTAPDEKSVLINCMDLHSESNAKGPWNQTTVRSDLYPAKDGFWTVSAEKASRFDVDIYRWAPESGLAINATAPEGRPTLSGKGTKSYPGLTDVADVKLLLNDKVIASVKKPNLSKQAITLKGVKIPAGEHTLKVLLTDSTGREFSAWYVNFTEK